MTLVALGLAARLRAAAQETRSGRGRDPAFVVGAPKGPPLAGTALDARTEEVGALLRCPVCQGLSVADSPATMASNMKAQVRELLAAGYDRGADPRLLRALVWRVRAAPAPAAGRELAGVARTRGGAPRRRGPVFLALRRVRGGRGAHGGAHRRASPRATRCPTTRASPRPCSACASSPTAGRAASAPSRAAMNGAASSTGRPPSLVLAVGLVLGGSSCGASSRPGRGAKAAAHENEALELRDLAGKRDALLAQLRELEDTASKRTPEQLARERYALELEAAQALLALDARGARPARPRARRARAGHLPAPPSAAATPSARSCAASCGARSAQEPSSSCSSSSTPGASARGRWLRHRRAGRPA